MSDEQPDADYILQLERNYGATVALLARIVACDGGHGSHGYHAGIALKAREDALDLIANIRPDWTARQEWSEAFKAYSPATASADESR